MNGTRQQIQYSLALEQADQGEAPVSGHQRTEPFVAKPAPESSAVTEQLMEEVCNLMFIAAVAPQWRETTADAVYVIPNIPVPHTAGSAGLWTGAYGQIRAEYAFNSHLSGAIEAVYFGVGGTIRRAGGHDSDYVGVELNFG